MATGYLRDAGQSSVVGSVESLQQGSFGSVGGFVAPCHNDNALLRYPRVSAASWPFVGGHKTQWKGFSELGILRGPSSAWQWFGVHARDGARRTLGLGKI